MYLLIHLPAEVNRIFPSLALHGRDQLEDLEMTLRITATRVTRRRDVMLHTRIRCSKSLQKHSLAPPPARYPSISTVLSLLSPLRPTSRFFFSVLKLVTGERNAV